MAGNDFFDSILGDFYSTSTSNDTSNKYKTSDFQLDDILKEFGLEDDGKSSIKKSSAAYSFDQSMDIGAAPAKTGDNLLSGDMWKELFDSPSAAKPTPAPNPSVLSSMPETAPVYPSSNPASAPAPLDIPEETATRTLTRDKDEARRYIAELFGAPSDTSADFMKTTVVETENEIAAADKLIAQTGPAAHPPAAQEDVPAAPVRPIKRILSERDEENFKMRSGYIDLKAIREATAAIDQIPGAPAGKAEKKPARYSSLNTEQRALFGKIGDFFSDATFQFDTSSVNNITADTINGRPRKARKSQQIDEEELKINEDIEDIYDKKDLPDVEQELLFQVSIAGIKSIITLILAVPLALLNLFPDFILRIAPSLSVSSPFNHAIANLAILFVIALLNFNIIGKGIAGIFRLRPTGSSLSALSMLVTMGYCVYVLAANATITAMYSVVAALSVVFVLLGKYVYYKNVLKNFEILAFESPKTACTSVAGGYSLKELYTENQRIAACRPVDLITRFLNNSFDYNFSDRVSKVSIIGAILVVVGSVVGAFLLNDVESVFALAAVAACAITPFCYDLSYSLPMLTVSAKIRRNGSSVVSYTKAEDFSKTTMLVMSDSDLFKPEHIVVHSMKINGNDRINDVIINCSSLINESGSPVAGAFMNILDNKTEMLLPVYNFDWAPERGFSGYINNVKYFVGSSRYLADCGIKLPTVDLEEKYKRAGRQVIMFADSTKLLAVFSISYCRDEQIFENLHKTNLDGLDVLILTRDSNIVPALMSEIYEIPASHFKIASKAEFDRLYHNNTPKPKHPAGIYSITGASGITYALANCKRLLSTIKASVVMRTIALACSAIVLLLLCLMTPNVLSILTPGKMLTFHLMWMLPSLFIAIFAG